MEFRNRIKEVCAKRGILLKDLASELGISVISLSHTINQPYPQLQSLERIAKVLKVEVYELFPQHKESTDCKCPHCGSILRIS